MDRSFIGSKNRYALLSEAEDMDSIQVVEQSIEKISLEEKAETDVRESHQGESKTVQSKVKGMAPPRPKMRSIFTARAGENIQRVKDKKDQHQDVAGSRTRDEAQLSTRDEAQLSTRDEAQLTTLPEKADDWTELQRKDKTRPRKGRGGLSRRELFNDRGKREYDRLSGSQKSGIKPVEKRDGGGARNWGRLSDNYELLHDDDQTTDVAGENVESKAVSKPSKSDDGRAQQMTLDEWKEQRKGSLSFPSYKLRKAGEGTDQTQWGEFHLLKKKTEEDPSQEETCHAHSIRSKMPSKMVKPLDVLFPEESFSSSHQGRHTGRSGKLAKSPKAIQQSAHSKESTSKACSIPKFDESDFPSLGGL